MNIEYDSVSLVEMIEVLNILDNSDKVTNCGEAGAIEIFDIDSKAKGSETNQIFIPLPYMVDADGNKIITDDNNKVALITAIATFLGASDTFREFSRYILKWMDYLTPKGGFIDLGEDRRKVSLELNNYYSDEAFADWLNLNYISDMCLKCENKHENTGISLDAIILKHFSEFIDNPLKLINSHLSRYQISKAKVIYPKDNLDGYTWLLTNDDWSISDNYSEEDKRDFIEEMNNPDKEMKIVNGYMFYGWCPSC